jgi:chorismate dehydratase
MEKIRISAVKYANTYPFIWGLRESGFDKRVILETDHPADCAAKLIDGRADLGLVPVAALPLIKNYRIISDYCLSANGKVRTVMLFSNCPPEEVEAVNLDFHSISSVNLIKILAKNMWHRSFSWINTTESSDFEHIGKNEGIVMIGDKCFEFENKFRFSIDLAGEWKKQTGLPFVFACWASNRELPSDFKKDFNDALKMGIENIDRVSEDFGPSIRIGPEILRNYLTVNMNFNLDPEKRKGMKLFLDMLSKL